MIKQCADTAAHEPHLWRQQEHVLLEGDPLSWCAGVASPAVPGYEYRTFTITSSRLAENASYQSRYGWRVVAVMPVTAMFGMGQKVMMLMEREVL